MNKRVGTTQKTLSDLNDDCLHHILSFLPVLDKLILGNYLREDRVLQVLSKQDVFYIEDCMTRLTVDETKQILERFGCQIKNISLALPTCFLPYERIPYYELIPAHCRSLEAIRFFYSDWKSEPEIFQKILFTNKSLESISIMGKDERFPHRLLSTIGNMQRIKYLDLPLLNKVSGAEISQMTNLVEFGMNHCKLFREKNFIKLMNGNNLKYLDISNCCLLKDGALQALFDTQQELEYLIIRATTNVNYESIGQLKKLKQLMICDLYEREVISASEGIANLPNLELLEISSLSAEVANIFLSCIVSLKNLKFLYLPRYQHLNDNDLRAIALKIPNLEELWINIGDDHGASDVIADGLVELIRDLKNLQKCHVAPDAIRLNLYLLHRFIEAKKQGNPQPLKIYWKGYIHEDLLKSPLYLNNLDIVEFRRGEIPYRHRWRKNKLFLFE